MQFLPVILAVAIAALVNVADAKIEKEKKEEVIKQCQEESKASDSDVALAKKHLVPETHEGKCFIACSFTKYGMMKEGKLDIEGVNKFFVQAFDIEENRDKAIKAAAGCFASEDVKGLDECEAASKYMTCVKANPEFESYLTELEI